MCRETMNIINDMLNHKGFMLSYIDSDIIKIDKRVGSISNYVDIKIEFISKEEYNADICKIFYKRECEAGELSDRYVDIVTYCFAKDVLMKLDNINKI